jgi:hypothetical protein
MKPEAKVMKWFQDAGIKKVIFFTVACKLAALVVVAAGAFFLPFQSDNYFANFHYPPNQSPDFLTRFATWDAPHYLYLADFGYKPSLLSNAFYPMFPWLIHLFGFLFFNNHILTGLFLSSLFTVEAMIFMYQVVREFYNESTALNACALLLMFPTGFFLGFIYPDSLFLMLVTALFYFEMKNKKKFYLPCALLLPLCKPIGMVAVLPLAFKVLWDGGKGKFWKTFEILVCSLIGLTSYFLIMKIYTGDMMAGFEAQNYYHDSKSFSHLFHPIDWFVNNFVNIELSFNSPFTGFLDRFFFVVYLFLLAFSWQILPRHLFVYVLVVGMISGLSGDMTSFMRYLVVLFPLFITMAIRFKSFIWYLVGGCAVIQIVFILLYSINDWVN